MHFLKLIRFKTLITIALVQIVFHFGFLKTHTTELAISDWQFLLLVLSTLCIAGGGFLINDVFNKTINRINEPESVIIDKHISEAAAYNYYIILNIVGVGIGFYLSNFIGKPSFSAIFIIVAATLYLYASSLKKILVVGNIIIASIWAISILIVGIYDLLAVITPENQPLMGMLFGILIDYALLTFLLSLVAGIIKDFSDKNKDLDSGRKTLPIILSEKTVKILLSVLLAMGIVAVGWYSVVYMFDKDLYIATLYVFGLVLSPLIYVLVRLWSAVSPKDYLQLHKVLRVVFLLAMLSVWILVYTIQMSNSIV